MSGLENPQLDKLRSIRAVTIRQVYEADLIRDSLYRIDGKDIDQVTFIGNVTQISILPAGAAIEVEDGTAKISIIRWMEPKDDDPDFMDELSSQGIVEGKYVRVSGSLHSYKNRPKVTAYTVRPVESGNEMMYHLLEAIAQHLHIARGPLVPAHEMQIDGNNTSDGYTQHPPAPRASQKHANTAAQKIMDYLATLADANMLPDDGVQDKIIAQEAGLPLRIVLNELPKLCESGEIYSAHDAHHFFPTAT